MVGPLERCAADRLAVFTTAAAALNATAQSIVAEVVKEALVLSGTPNTDPSAGAGGAVALAAVREDAIQAALFDAKFRAVMTAVATRDLTTAVGRRLALEDAFQSKSSLILRLLHDGNELLARKHPLLSTLHGLRSEIGRYVGHFQAVNTATGQVPERARQWSFTGENGTETALLNQFLTTKNFASLDCLNGKCGAYQLRGLISGAIPKVVDKRDFYCVVANLEVWGDFMNRTLGALGMPVVVEPPFQGYTILTWCAFYTEHIKLAHGLSSLREQVVWLYYAHQQFVGFLSVVQGEIDRFLRSGRPATATMPFLAPLDCAPAENLRRKQHSHEQLLEHRTCFDWMLGGQKKKPVDPTALPLLSENWNLVKQNFEGVQGGGAGGGDDDAVNPRKKAKKTPSGGGGSGKIPPGSRADRCVWLGANELMHQKWVFNVAETAKDFSVDQSSIDWGVALCCLKGSDRLAFCCDVAGHGDLSQPMHRSIPGLDPNDRAFRDKYGRNATAEELAKLPASFLSTPGTATDASESSGGRGKGKGKGKGKGRGRGKGGRGRGGRRGPRGGAALESQGVSISPLYLDFSAFTPPARLCSGAVAYSRLLAPHLGLLDAGGFGRCGANALAAALMLRGEVPAGEIYQAGSDLRGQVCAHGLLASTQTSQPAQPGGEIARGDPMLFGSIMITAMTEWNLAEMMSKHGFSQLTCENYCAAMADDDTWVDGAFLALAADLKGITIRVLLASQSGKDDLGPPWVFVPREGRESRFEVTLLCLMDYHFLLVLDKSDLLPAGHTPGASEQARLWHESCVAVRALADRLEVDFPPLSRAPAPRRTPRAATVPGRAAAPPSSIPAGNSFKVLTDQSDDGDLELDAPVSGNEDDVTDALLALAAADSTAMAELAAAREQAELGEAIQASLSDAGARAGAGGAETDPLEAALRASAREIQPSDLEQLAMNVALRASMAEADAAVETAASLEACGQAANSAVERAGAPGAEASTEVMPLQAAVERPVVLCTPHLSELEAGNATVNGDTAPAEPPPTHAPRALAALDLVHGLLCPTAPDPEIRNAGDALVRLLEHLQHGFGAGSPQATLKAAAALQEFYIASCHVPFPLGFGGPATVGGLDLDRRLLQVISAICGGVSFKTLDDGQPLVEVSPRLIDPSSDSPLMLIVPLLRRIREVTLASGVGTRARLAVKWPATLREGSSRRMLVAVLARWLWPYLLPLDNVAVAALFPTNLRGSTNLSSLERSFKRLKSPLVELFAHSARGAPPAAQQAVPQAAPQVVADAMPPAPTPTAKRPAAALTDSAGAVLEGLAPRDPDKRARPEGPRAATDAVRPSADSRLQRRPPPDGYTWPLRSLEEVTRLANDPEVRLTDLVGCEFSGAMSAALESEGRVVLSVDHRECELGGMHAMLDLRCVVSLRRWERAFLFPPCFQQLRADRDCLPLKLQDGRAFWGCAFVLFCICVEADVLVVEQPDTIFADYYAAAYYNTRSSSFQDFPDKFIRLYVRNALLAPRPIDNNYRTGAPSQFLYADPDERDRLKSTWAPYRNLCRELARLQPQHIPAPAAPVYADEIERFAVSWHQAGHLLPLQYDAPQALPPTEELRAYQLVRGAGNGRPPASTVPATLAPARASEASLAWWTGDQDAIPAGSVVPPPANGPAVTTVNLFFFGWSYDYWSYVLLMLPYTPADSTDAGQALRPVPVERVQHQDGIGLGLSWLAEHVMAISPATQPAWHRAAVDRMKQLCRTEPGAVTRLQQEPTPAFAINLDLCCENSVDVLDASSTLRLVWIPSDALSHSEGPELTPDVDGTPWLLPLSPPVRESLSTALHPPDAGHVRKDDASAPGASPTGGGGLKRQRMGPAEPAVPASSLAFVAEQLCQSEGSQDALEAGKAVRRAYLSAVGLMQRLPVAGGRGDPTDSQLAAPSEPGLAAGGDEGTAVSHRPPESSPLTLATPDVQESDPVLAGLPPGLLASGWTPVKAAKVCFVADDHCFVYTRADSSVMRPQFDFFGGRMDPQDEGSLSACALREVANEELFLPDAWLCALREAVQLKPEGHAQYQILRPRWSERHDVALWVVHLPAAERSATPALRPGGRIEARGAPGWRSFSEVLANLAGFAFAKPITSALVDHRTPPPGTVLAPDVARERAGGLLRPPTLDLRAAGRCAVVLVFVSVLMRPLVFAHVNGFTVCGIELPEEGARSSCVAAAQTMVDAAVGTGYHSYLVGEYDQGSRVVAAPLDFSPPASGVCFSRAQRRGLLRSGATFLWCTLAALQGTVSGDVAGRVVASAEAFVKPVAQLADFPSTLPYMQFRFGAAPVTSAVARPNLESLAVQPAWRALHQNEHCNSILREALAAYASDSLLDGWADRIQPLPVDEIPPRLLQNLHRFDDDQLDALPFSAVVTPLSTPWVPLPPLQAEAPPDTPACVRSPFDMMPASTRVRVEEWLEQTLGDLLDIRDAPPETPPEKIPRSRPPPLVIGQSELHPWARGRVWDCRGECCKVADFRAPFDTHLNLEYLRRRLEHYPDQTLVSNVLEGVRLEADVELQTVLVPHLMSLPLGYKSVSKELRRLRGLGWYQFFHDFPFRPMYLNGQGATARKLEPDRFRRTTEGGGPRKPTFDASGLPAISINDASRRFHVPQYLRQDGRPAVRDWLAQRGLSTETESGAADESQLPREGGSKWPKERKPHLEQVMRDLAILRRAAEKLNEPIYVFGDDAKDYFNQLAMASSELHKLGIVFLQQPADNMDELAAPPYLSGYEGERLIFVSELRLGFGTHGASNIAQRFSDALLHLFRLDMDAAEAAAVPTRPSRRRAEWMAARVQAAEAALAERDSSDSTTGSAAPGESRDDLLAAEVTVQSRLYAAYMFTDDPLWITVGAERTVRALRVWRQLTNDINLIMAIPEKRNLGTHALWLGVVIIATLGIVVVPRPKLLRAAATIRDVLAGGLAARVDTNLLLASSMLHGKLRDQTLPRANLKHTRRINLKFST